MMYLVDFKGEMGFFLKIFYILGHIYGLTCIKLLHCHMLHAYKMVLAYLGGGTSPQKRKAEN